MEREEVMAIESQSVSTRQNRVARRKPSQNPGKETVKRRARADDGRVSCALPDYPHWIPAQAGIQGFPSLCRRFTKKGETL